MEIIKDIAYAPAHGVRGRLDVVIPEGGRNLPVVLVVHGGGMRSLSKERMHRVAEFVAEEGWAAVNVNYRLLPDRPFPAPLEDVLAAFRWIEATDLDAVARQDRSRVALLGASAGGYLVLASGFLLGREKVRAIVDVSGPATRERGGAGVEGSGKDPRLFRSPMDLAGPGSPPLLALHSRRDGVVDPGESDAIVARVKEVGGQAELYSYDGPDELHGIWCVQNDPQPRLLPYLEEAIAAFLRKHLT